MAKKLTIKQKGQLRDEAYNVMFNKLFELHKYLVEHPYSTHSVGEGDPVEDAILLIEKLTDSLKHH